LKDPLKGSFFFICGPWGWFGLKKLIFASADIATKKKPNICLQTKDFMVKYYRNGTGDRRIG